MTAAALRVPVLEVGGSHVSAAWVDPAGWSVSGLSRASLLPDADGQQLLADLARAAGSLAAPPGVTWAIAMPGPFDYHTGVAHYRGVGKFEGLTGLDVGAGLRGLLDERPGEIRFVNDASAFLIGEWLIGSAVGAGRCAALTLGTGIGSAFLDHGTVVDDGPSVPPLAEVHLLDHEDVPLEDWISSRALRRDYARLTGTDGSLEVKEIAERARAGDQHATSVFEHGFQILGQVVGPWLDRFGIDQLVVGGSISLAWDLIVDPFRDGLCRYSKCRYSIDLAAQPELAPLVGTGYMGQLSS